MHVIKASGKRDKFNPKKLERTLFRAGAQKETVRAIIAQVEKEVYDGITTKKVYKRVLELLDKYQPSSSPCYDLKQAIMRLGPAGFPFETYLSQILKEHGYRTKLRTKLKGRCATHEIDIIAERQEGGEWVRSLIEVKFHNSSGTYIDLKEALYTYARFLDLNHTRNNFDEVWLSCNTKVSRDAKAYARCNGIKLLCWRYPPNKGLETLIDKKKLYPITALRNIDPETVSAFSKVGYMLMKDLLEVEYSRLKAKTRLPSKKLNALIEEARKVCMC